MNRISNYLEEGVQFLTASQVSDAEISASSLLSFVLNRPRLSLFAEQDVTLNWQQQSEYEALLKKRATRYPLQYLLRWVPFRNIVLEIGENCLIPRPETELLVETVLNQLDVAKDLRILDLATGSGNIAISLAKESQNWKVYASDCSQQALVYAEKNAQNNQVSKRLHFVQSDLFEHVEGTFDAIVSNPPYLKTEELENAQKELHYEPHIALDGGRDGLHFYRRIISEAGDFLKKDGFIFFEIGYDQACAVSDLLKSHHFRAVEIKNDYSGLKRIISGRKRG